MRIASHLRRLFVLAVVLTLPGARVAIAQDSQVVPIPMGDAVKVSLNNYYDILKAQIGNLGAEEYLQLKVAADPVDISDEKYRYWSQYNLLNRSDLAIEPQPTSSTILTSATQLNRVYGRFLQRLRSYVVRKELTADEQLKLADLDVQTDRAKDKLGEYEEKELARWERHCKVTRTDLGNDTAYLQWRAVNGYRKEMDELNRDLRGLYFDKKTITDRKYADPEDREVIDSEYAYEDPAMRLRYPINPDYMYSDRDKFSLEYLARLDDASTALFDSRRALTWNVALQNMPTMAAGSFDATFDRTTSDSNSIETDWKVSASVSYFFVSAKASASEQKQISEDFKKTTSVKVAAKAAYKVQIVYPGWFRPELFKHKYVTQNSRDFQEFFGPQGTLLYYPVSLVFVRGFSTAFESTQAWSYDYDKKFSASGGGGFSVFGIGFGSEASYGEHVAKHKVDKANTKLTFSDGESTIRFVGYVVKRNVGSGVKFLAASSLPITEPGLGAKAARDFQMK